MSKKINLTVGNPQNANSLAPDIQNFNVEQLSTLFSCSVDMIYCTIFNMFDETNVYQALDAILDKIKPGGSLLITVPNLKRIAKLFVDGVIPNKDFFQNIRSINNSVSYNDIIQYCKQKNNIIIADLKKEETISFITINKTGV